ncbi:plasmid stabilization protein StbA [Serratia symbiotica]|uniref:Plasmid stability protein StbA n=2 Tax=Serratia symbiotica TaxID=138074 RepID=A0A455VJ28_9GAMM|nr:plasmid stabilization protein StbA [Serratia symbiotica]BBI93097.1 plasmid stability protein StbA [Serratia symbiotica]
MKPKSIRGAIQMMLPEVEEMLSLGVSREDVFKVVSERFNIANVNVRSFDTALYRARVKRSKLEKSTNLSYRKDELEISYNPLLSKKRQTEEKKAEGNNIPNKGIIGKEFFDEINDSFDPNKFIDKY